MINVPIIEIRLREMGNELTSYFATYQADIEKEVKAAVAHSVKNFNFEGEVRRQADRVIQESVKRAVESYFAFGGGAKMIDKMVTGILAEANKQDAND